MSTQYPLGTSDLELERLAFQHEVWGAQTRAFLDALRVGAGMRVLDLGCGPGFVTCELAERVGPNGSVLAVDESERWIAHVEHEVAHRRLERVTVRRSRIQDLALEPRTFDVVFARWVFSFLPGPAGVARELARALVSGGDVWIAGSMARVFEAAGFELEHLDTHVLCGGPNSPAFQWADRFFPHFAGVMEEQGILAHADRELFEREWEERKRDPNALFFSPIVVDAAGRKTT